MELCSVQRLGGCTFGIFRLFPYLEAQGVFSLQKDWTINIVTETAAEGRPPALSARGALARRLNEIASNPEMIPIVIHAQNYVPPRPTTNPCDHLIITGKELESAFAPLIARRILEGIHAETVSVESIQASQTGVDLAEKIRNFIRAMYEERGVTSVLLGGDVRLIPTRMAFLSRGGSLTDSLVPCDLYFGCLDGSWNRDADDLWGETTDGDDGGDVDLLPEVDIGRAPVRNTAEARSFVQKAIAQADADRTPPSALFLNDSLPAPIDGAGADPLSTGSNSLSGWKLRRLVDDLQNKTTWTADQALQEINRSPALIAYYGHGDPEHVMRLTSDHLGRMKNQRPFLFASIGCELGRFDHDAFTSPSIGEQLVLQPQYGAFAAVLNAREGWFDSRSRGRYSHEFQESLFRQLNAGERQSLGRLVSASKELFLGAIERSGYMPYRACYLQWTLLGDPAARLNPRIGGELPSPSKGGTNAP